MGPTWVLSAPDGPHIGPTNLAIRDIILTDDTKPIQLPKCDTWKKLCTRSALYCVLLWFGIGTWHKTEREPCAYSMTCNGYLTVLSGLTSQRDGVSSHRRLDCLLNRLFRWRSKKTSKLGVTGLCEGWPVNSPRKHPVPRKMSPFDDIIMSQWMYQTVSVGPRRWPIHSIRFVPGYIILEM